MNYLKPLLKLLLRIILIPVKLILSLLLNVLKAIHRSNQEVIEREWASLKRGYEWLHFLFLSFITITILYLIYSPLIGMVSASSTESESQSSYSDQLSEDLSLKFPESELLKSIEGAENWDIFPVISNHSLDQIEKLRYAYQISNDKDFVYTLKAENGTIDPFRRSDIIGKNGRYDWGLCQLNYQWHSKFIDSPDFNDWRKQIDYCWGVFQKRNGAFYGFYNRHRVKHYFTFE